MYIQWYVLDTVNRFGQNCIVDVIHKLQLNMMAPGVLEAQESRQYITLHNHVTIKSVVICIFNRNILTVAILEPSRNACSTYPTIKYPKHMCNSLAHKVVMGSTKTCYNTTPRV